MKKAESIEDIYDVFTPEQYLTKEDKEFYVDLYGDKLKRLVTALKFNKVPSKTFFIAGQTGNGKSTVLNLLTTNFEEIEDASETLKLGYSPKVNNMKTFLIQIEQKKAYEDNSENLINIAKATKMELVFAYFNGIEWYELNPVIKDALQKYNAKYYNEALAIFEEIGYAHGVEVIKNNLKNKEKYV